MRTSNELCDTKEAKRGHLLVRRVAGRQGRLLHGLCSGEKETKVTDNQTLQKKFKRTNAVQKATDSLMNDYWEWEEVSSCLFHIGGGHLHAILKKHN